MGIESLGKDERELAKSKAPNGASTTGSERINRGLACCKQTPSRTKHPGECAEESDEIAAGKVPRLPGREVASNHREMARQTRGEGGGKAER